MLGYNGKTSSFRSSRCLQLINTAPSSTQGDSLFQEQTLIKLVRALAKLIFLPDTQIEVGTYSFRLSVEFLLTLMSLVTTGSYFDVLFGYCYLFESLAHVLVFLIHYSSVL